MEEELEWKIPEESEESEEETEEPEEPEEDEQELENIIQETPTSFIRRIDAEQVDPFLKQEPIEAVENLEQDLQDVPGQAQENQEEAAPYEAINAPQYASAYESNYEIIREAQRPADPEMAGGALIRREEDIREIGGLQERSINFQRWQQTNVERGPEQQERYIRETSRFKEEDKLPFQRKRKRLF